MVILGSKQQKQLASICEIESVRCQYLCLSDHNSVSAPVQRVWNYAFVCVCGITAKRTNGLNAIGFAHHYCHCHCHYCSRCKLHSTTPGALAVSYQVYCSCFSNSRYFLPTQKATPTHTHLMKWRNVQLVIRSVARGINVCHFDTSTQVFDSAFAESFVIFYLTVHTYIRAYMCERSH